MRARKPTAEEARGRKFAKLMENSYSWRDLTGRQLEQVLAMAEQIHTFMNGARSRRTTNP